MKIELLKPHTHAGRDYPVGTTLELSQGDAQWLVAIDVAKTVTTPPAQAPSAPTPLPLVEGDKSSPTRKEK